MSLGFRYTLILIGMVLLSFSSYYLNNAEWLLALFTYIAVGLWLALWRPE